MAPKSPEGSQRLAGIRDGKAPSQWVHPLTPGFSGLLSLPGLCPDPFWKPSSQAASALPPFPLGDHSKAPHKYFPESASKFFFFSCLFISPWDPRAWKSLCSHPREFGIKGILGCVDVHVRFDLAPRDP